MDKFQVAQRLLAIAQQLTEASDNFLLDANEYDSWAACYIYSNVVPLVEPLKSLWAKVAPQHTQKMEHYMTDVGFDQGTGMANASGRVYAMFNQLVGMDEGKAQDLIQDFVENESQFQ